jgi:hypothetical protein
MFVCCECYVLSGRALCDGLITRPDESYRMWRVVVCDQGTSKNEEAKVCYRAVENTTTMDCNTRKTNKQQANSISCFIFVLVSLYKFSLKIYFPRTNSANMVACELSELRTERRDLYFVK